MITNDNREGTSMTTSVTQPGLPLSPRERQVLALIAAGHTDQQIAKQLYIGVDTAKTVAKRIYTKLGATNRPSAVNAGWERGILGDPDHKAVTSLVWQLDELLAHYRP